MNKKKGIVLMIIGAVLIILSLCLFVYNNLEDKQAEQIGNDTVSELNSLLDSPKKQNSSLIPKKTTVLDVNGEGYIGVLYFPSIDLQLPVMEDWSYEQLKKAPCLYYGSVLENNMVIAGHNYKSHFGRLTNLKIGDSVIFTSADAVVYSYTVADIEKLGAYDIEEMVNSGWDLSLYTCDYSGSNRITVRCSLGE